jgi:Mce-associated membrane protein
VSDTNGPVRRRRIAGESGPAAPAKKPVTRRAVARQALAAKAPTAKAPVAKAPDAKTPVAKVSVARATTATKPSVAKAPAAGAASSPERTRSGPGRRDWLWLVPAVLVAVASIVAGTFLVLNQLGSDDADIEASGRQASSAAGTAAETIFSFRYDQLDQHLKESKALMTPAFAKEFDKIAPALTELAPQRKIVVEAVTRESAAMPCGDDCSATAADVLVFVDQARLVGDSTTPTVFANRIKVSMVKKADGWVVSNIRAL